jgi:hypothetical protein
MTEILVVVMMPDGIRAVVSEPWVIDIHKRGGELSQASWFEATRMGSDQKMQINPRYIAYAWLGTI